MICGMGFDSEHIALTSRIIFKLGEESCYTKAIASAAVLMKLVSVGESGSKQMVTSRSSACLTGSRNASIVHVRAASTETPGRILRCLGEPTTITVPPRSAQKSTKAQK